MTIEDARINKNAFEKVPDIGSRIGSCRAIVYSVNVEVVKAQSVPTKENCETCKLSAFCDKSKKS